MFPVLYPEAFNRGIVVYRILSSIQMDAKSGCKTLRSILTNIRYRKVLATNLRYRLNLAKSLANAVFHLHSVNWIHGSLRPETILIFGRESSDVIEFEWSRPYIIGLAMAMSAWEVMHQTSGRLPDWDLWAERVYKHPRSQYDERTRKSSDIYSLGILLLEIGLLKSLMDSDYRRDAIWTSAPPHELSDLLTKLSNQLISTVGPTYCDIVKNCLEGEYYAGDEASQQMFVRVQVCERLEDIQF